MARKVWTTVQLVGNGKGGLQVNPTGAKFHRATDAEQNTARRIETARAEGKPNAYLTRELVRCPECNTEHNIRRNIAPDEPVACDCGKVWYPGAN